MDDDVHSPLTVPAHTPMTTPTPMPMPMPMPMLVHKGTPVRVNARTDVLRGMDVHARSYVHACSAQEASASE